MSQFIRERLLFYPAKFSLYESIFEHLDLSKIKEQLPKTGRRPFSREALCRALVYKNLKGIKTLSELSFELSSNLGIAYILGFDKRIPSRHRFEEFLHKIPNQLLQEVRNTQLKTLTKLDVVSGKYLSIDSTAIVAWVKQNNPKIFVEGKFDKTKFPQGDPDARLGVMATSNKAKYLKERQLEFFKASGKNTRKITYFWGYRNHVIFDSLSELPVFEKTLPANISECTVTVQAFKELRNNLKYRPRGVLADAAHDTENIRKYIRCSLKAKDFIPLIPRTKRTDIRFTKHNTRVCIAGLEMCPWGKFKDRGRIRRKFVCPVTHLKGLAEKYNHQCPVNHPNFSKGGCYAYTRVDKSYRSSAMSPASEYFKKIYRMQSGSERGFSRLLNFYMQRPMLTGLNAVSNHCTLAHISILAIAITAVKAKQKSKIRFIRGLLKQLLNK